MNTNPIEPSSAVPDCRSHLIDVEAKAPGQRRGLLIFLLEIGDGLPCRCPLHFQGMKQLLGQITDGIDVIAPIQLAAGGLEPKALLHRQLVFGHGLDPSMPELWRLPRACCGAENRP